MVYVARSKQAKKKMQPLAATPTRAVQLACGHTVEAAPALSNPDRWWCCDAWRRAR